jgi:hypothetical protein
MNLSVYEMLESVEKQDTKQKKIDMLRSYSNVQALMTGLTCIGRVDRNQFNPCLNCLVGEKQTQLIERPTIRATALGFVSGLRL